MDRERRTKRKNMENERSVQEEEEEEEEEDEEEKMEKFFALIRSTKDVRDRLIARNHVQVDTSSKIFEDNHINIKSANTSAANIGVNWNPQDFMGIDTIATAGPSTSNSKKQEEGGGGGGEEQIVGKKEEDSKEGKNNHHMLDLNLSL
uniref:Protein NIM1-INTERACTING 1-like n=2 Tax=Nicotiana TaxID=4085 RepID=A0A1S4B9J9_TOBAC|nr:PREDICTED: protein NIM1-INTERACTING 1-like [Nicotiana sylvestris]XP_016485549.1 PREDICTED: protein NIM1-INTERACTING 1-like [Nicotiana tabacum]